ncbi:MAG TPA: PDDEXK nuclease domain-containing protein [Bryobacteraceae bacterium]|nr:PDDEXK nuclease domain-containing protein [Bryobacteraceae bacterium]
MGSRRRVVKARLGYGALYEGIVELLENARKSASRAVNSVITSAYWEVGRRIVQEEQRGRRKAGYGERLMDQLAGDLTAKFGRGFSRTNVFQMRQFYVSHASIIQTLSGQSSPSSQARKIQTLSGQSSKALEAPKIQTLSELLPTFPLSWSHYVCLMSVQDEAARAFYENRAFQEGWSVRQLDRQIASQFYERSKRAKRTRVPKAQPSTESQPHEELTPDEHIRDPFVLEFLGLKDEYSESQLEEELVLHLEHFLLELGDDFTFMARQKRLRVGDQWYRVDLLFFHRRLRCLVLIDLKLGRFTHADAGQMNLYLNFAREHWTHADENPPIGIILCSERDDAVAHYALGNLHNRVLAREYKLGLPDERVLIQEISQTRRAIQLRVTSPQPSS